MTDSLTEAALIAARDAEEVGDEIRREVAKLLSVLEEIGCLDEHYCPASPIRFDYVDDMPEKFQVCIRCAALGKKGES